MPSSRKTSPARSQDANISSRKLRIRRTLSVGSPARSNVSGRLTSIIDETKKKQGSFVLSPLSNRKSILTDNTFIDKPGRTSWWKKLGDNSRDVIEVLNSNEAVDPNNFIEEYANVLSQEKKNYTLDLPESSDNESINSIVVPQRRLFTQQSTQNKNNYDNLIGNRDTLAKINKTNNDLHDKSVKVTTKNLFNLAPKRVRPAFPEALLTVSPNKTIANKTKEMVTADVKGQVRTLFGNRPGTKRKNMFVDFIVSESEDEIPDIQPKVFGFPKKPDDRRRPSSNSRGTREPSPTSSIATDIEMDDWKLLPSSTMVENQIEEMMTAVTPVKRARLSKFTEDKESAIGTNTTANKTKVTNKSLVSNNNSKNSSIKSSALAANQIEDMEIDTLSNKEARSSKFSESKEFDGSKNVTANKTRVINKSLTSNNKSNLSAVKNNTVLESHIANNLNNECANEKGETIEENGVAVQNQTRNTINENTAQHSKSKTDNIGSHISLAEKSLLEVNKTKKPHDDTNDARQVSNNEGLEKYNLLEKSKTALQDEQESEDDTKLEYEDDIELDEPSNGQSIHSLDGQDVEVMEMNTLKTLDSSKKVINESIHHNANKEAIQELEEKSGQDNSQEQYKNRKSEHSISKQKEKNYTSIAEDKEQTASSKSIHNIVEDIKQDNNDIGENNDQLDLENEINNAEESELHKNELNIDNSKSNEKHKSREEEDSEKDAIEQNIEDENDQDDNEQNVADVSIEEESEQIEAEQTVIEDDNEQDEEEEQSIEEDNEEAAEEQSIEEDNEQDVEEQNIDEENEQTEEEQSIEEGNDQNDENSIAEENEESITEDNEESMEVEENSAINESSDEEEHKNESTVQEDLNESGENDASTEQIQEDEENSKHDESEEVIETEEDESENVNESHTENYVENQKQDEAKNGDVSQVTKEVSVHEEETQNDVSTSNKTHDTTGRHRTKKGVDKSPEAVLQNMTYKEQSFTMKGRNTSIRKTKSMIKPLNIKPSLAPARDSTGFSDGTKNSSAEGSGWDSHRTTRKTIRQTMGKEFSPRKSLRALVMEKSAKRYTAISDLNDDQIRVPQANSTQYPEPTAINEDEENDTSESPVSIHEVSKRTRQATLEMYLQSVKKKNQQQRQQIEEKVKHSLINPSDENANLFKVPSKPSFSLKRKVNSKEVHTKPKPKVIKSTIIPLEDLPVNLLEDMKYKPPKRYKPGNASWITKRLYNFFESKLEAKYDYKARIRAEKLVETIYTFTKDLKRHPVAPKDATAMLKREMARLNIVQTHFDFYNFFHEYMPREVRVKVVPDLVNKISLPKHGVFMDILTS